MIRAKKWAQFSKHSRRCCSAHTIKAEKKKLGEEVPEEPAKAASSGARKKKKTPDRGALKEMLNELKSRRREALEAKDSVQLKRIRRRYKQNNRTLRRTTASAA